MRRIPVYKFTVIFSLQQRIKYILRICPESTEQAKRLKSENIQFTRVLRMNNVTATKLYMYT